MAELDLTIPDEFRDCLRIGTCSWKYDSWKGLVYRHGVQYGPHDYLPDYARHFGTVEVDQWFWSLFPGGLKLPDPADARAYAESVPDDFTFTVKAPNSLTLTHYYSRQSKRYAEFAGQPNEHFLSVELLDRFLETLEPMGAKLGPIMFQFEYLNRKKMADLDAFLDALGAFFDAAPAGPTYAVESRNPNYLKPAFFDFLRERGLGYVFIDGYYMPPISKVFGENETAGGGFQVVRLHGPSRADIEKVTGRIWNRIVDEQPRGIEAAAQIVRANATKALRTYVNINNHYEGSAPLTAQRLLAQLRSAMNADDADGRR